MKTKYALIVAVLLGCASSPPRRGYSVTPEVVVTPTAADTAAARAYAGAAASCLCGAAPDVVRSRCYCQVLRDAGKLAALVNEQIVVGSRPDFCGTIVICKGTEP